MDTCKLSKANRLEREIGQLKQSIKRIQMDDGQDYENKNRTPQPLFHKDTIAVFTSRTSDRYMGCLTPRFYPFEYMDDEDVLFVQKFILSKLESKLAVLEAQFAAL